jgi:opacity protein-like surface antigen
MKGGLTVKRISQALIVCGLAIFLLLTSTSIAPAAEQGPFYVGIFGGYVMPQDLSVSDGPDVPLKDSWTLGIKGGYIIPQAKYLAIELEYAYLGTQDIDMSGVDGDFSASNLMLNFLLRYPEGKYHPYVGVGIGWSMGSFKATQAGVGSIDENDSAFAWQILAGINFEITPQWSADLAYRYFAGSYSISSGGDNIDLDAKNHMILIGVNYHF